MASSKQTNFRTKVGKELGTKVIASNYIQQLNTFHHRKLGVCSSLITMEMIWYTFHI